jgi:hypothetical protein
MGWAVAIYLAGLGTLLVGADRDLPISVEGAISYWRLVGSYGHVGGYPAMSISLVFMGMWGPHPGLPPRGEGDSSIGLSAYVCIRG